MGSTRPTVGAALLLAVAAVVALTSRDDSGDGTDRATPGGKAKSVTIADYVYEPARTVVPVGTTVRFANRDAAPHTATSKRSGAFDTGTIRKGKAGEVVLEEPGTFAYYCAFHPFMKGTIEVS
jgi:plastocyanin